MRTTAITAYLIRQAGFDHDDLLHFSGAHQDSVVRYLATQALNALTAVEDNHRAATRELERARASADRSAAALAADNPTTYLRTEAGIASASAARAETALAALAENADRYIEVSKVLHQAVGQRLYSDCTGRPAD
jgi:hypothetical protein